MILVRMDAFTRIGSSAPKIRFMNGVSCTSDILYTGFIYASADIFTVMVLSGWVGSVMIRAGSWRGRLDVVILDDVGLRDICGLRGGCSDISIAACMRYSLIVYTTTYPGNTSESESLETFSFSADMEVKFRNSPNKSSSRFKYV